MSRCPSCGGFGRRANGCGQNATELNRMCGKCYLKEKAQRRIDGTAGRGRAKAAARKRLREKRERERILWG